jgi:hypothetical protein
MIRVKIYYLKIGPMPHGSTRAGFGPCTDFMFPIFCLPAVDSPRLRSGEQLNPDPFVVVIAGIAVKPKQ